MPEYSVGLDFKYSPVYSLKDILVDESIVQEILGNMDCEILGDELTIFFCQLTVEILDVPYAAELLERMTFVDSRSLFNRQNCVQ